MVVISMMLLCNAGDIVEVDRSRSGFRNTPLNIGYNDNIIERDSLPNITNPCIIHVRGTWGGRCHSEAPPASA